VSDDVRTIDAAERGRRAGIELGQGPKSMDESEIRAAFLQRALAAIGRMAETADPERLQEALAVDTDVAVLKALGLARVASLSKFAAATDPLAAARARGEQAKRDLLAVQGEMLSVVEVAARLGCSVSEVEQRHQRGLLIALTDEYGKRGFPAWQFTDSGSLPGLEEVLADMGVDGPWSRAAFFFSGDIRLDWRTPLEVLLSGDVEAVRRAAAAYGEQVPA